MDAPVGARAVPQAPREPSSKRTRANLSQQKLQEQNVQQQLGQNAFSRREEGGVVSHARPERVRCTLRRIIEQSPLRQSDQDHCRSLRTTRCGENLSVVRFVKTDDLPRQARDKVKENWKSSRGKTFSHRGQGRVQIVERFIHRGRKRLRKTGKNRASSLFSIVLTCVPSLSLQTIQTKHRFSPKENGAKKVRVCVCFPRYYTAGFVMELMPG